VSTTRQSDIRRFLTVYTTVVEKERPICDRFHCVRSYLEKMGGLASVRLARSLAAASVEFENSIGQKIAERDLGLIGPVITLKGS